MRNKVYSLPLLSTKLIFQSPDSTSARAAMSPLRKTIVPIRKLKQRISMLSVLIFSASSFPGNVEHPSAHAFPDRSAG